jgi:hypothetical protein
VSNSRPAGRLTGDMFCATYPQSDAVEDHLAGNGGDVEVERGEAVPLHSEQQPEQKLLSRPPRDQHLHGGVPVRHGRLDVGHARTWAAGRVANGEARSHGGNGVLRGREEAGERLGEVAGGGGGVAALLNVQRLQAVLQFLDEVDGASYYRRLVTLARSS